MNPVPTPFFPRLHRPLLLGVALLTLLGISQPAEAYLVNEWEPLTMEGARPKTPQNIQTGTHWRDPLSEANLLWIRGGCFAMGSPPRATGREMDEGPVTQQCVSDFWLGETEITQGQWRRVMHNNPAKFRKGDRYPVENVSWEEVEEFITSLNEQNPLNVQFRLPTEAEWEYACRQGGQRTVFPGASEPGRIGWHRSNSDGSPHEVATRAPNRLGLKDMSGNVWEWVSDRYHASLETPSEDQEHQNDRERFYATRGGGWNDDGAALRCANRGFQSITTRRNDLGLRLAASLKNKEKKIKYRQTDIKHMPF
ncbi:MAG: formylglycine-generating enzyme family protein [Magnetococcales bacterium]|nr:formylglycine-generating enzyme family protein [Magnetococcales bacterium]